MKQLSDESLCSLALAGDADAVEVLVKRHSILVKRCVRPFFLAGADAEDLSQEGMLALLKAIYQFKPDQGASFETFAKTCITRRVYSLIRANQAKKNIPLTYSVSLDEKPLLEDIARVHSRLSLPHTNPEALVIGNEEREELENRLNSLLSKFEAKVLELYLQGLSYEEMSAVLQKPIKSVDNAIQRIRRKTASIHFN